MLQIKFSTCLNETTHYDTKTLADLKTCQTSYVTGFFVVKMFSRIRTLAMHVAMHNIYAISYLR